MRFVVEEAVFQQLPGVLFGVVVARGVDNSRPLPAVEQLLKEQVARVREQFAGVNVKEHPTILPYRQAFTRLGINPNKFPSSIEALVSRIARGGDCPRISPVVDMANAFCLKHLVPMGAHDMAKFAGDIMVRFSRPEDTFLPFGKQEAEQPGPGELVYASGNTIKTRRWIWRQSEDGKITTASRDIFFPIDGFHDSNLDAVTAARDELAAFLSSVLGCPVKTGLVNAANPVLEL
ncbi:MAG: B3/4 domain-containing protein [Bacillota bacterium]